MTIRRGQEAFNRGDLSAMAEVATADVEWSSTGVFPGIAPDYAGTEAIEQWG